MPSPITVVATYRPKEGHSVALSSRLVEHEAVLRQRNYLVEDPAIRLWIDADALLEIVDWKDDESRVRAAIDPAVQAAWLAVQDVAAHVSTADLP